MDEITPYDISRKSKFSLRLEANPELARLCSQFSDDIRNAAKPEVRVIERSERLTAADLGVIIY